MVSLVTTRLGLWLLVWVGALSHFPGLRFSRTHVWESTLAPNLYALDFMAHQRVYFYCCVENTRLRMEQIEPLMGSGIPGPQVAPGGLVALHRPTDELLPPAFYKSGMWSCPGPLAEHLYIHYSLTLIFKAPLGQVLLLSYYLFFPGGETES